MSDIIDDIDNLARDERDLRCEPNGSRWLKTYELLCAELVKHWPALSARLREAERQRDEWKWASEKNGDAMSGYQSRAIVAEQRLEGAKRERDAAINLAYQYPPSEPYNPDGVTWRQMYEMLDEKSLGDKHGHDCAVAALTEQRDAALARVAELEAKQPQPSAEAKADEALRLVEQLASTMQLLADLAGHQVAYSYCNDIIAAARKAGGA